MKDERIVFQAQLSAVTKKKMEQIARYREQSMTGLLRTWITSAHAKLPEEAK
jgi:hypothetical protein|tara:strand:+ start:751 stop:906 length:156 start_codon:yes stop_codon:yes gene_type:complete